jgi:drug/metabolite transporter (DMT)-like permease
LPLFNVYALVALLSALAYGASDFLAGLMSRRASVFVVTLVAQSAAAAVTWIALPWFAGPISSSAIAWGAAAGAGAFAGTVCLYRGLAIGRMSIVGPLSAVFSAAGATLAGVLLGDRLTALEVGGIVSACAAIALVTAGDGGRSAGGDASGRAIAYALAAGAGFGLLFVALKRAGNGSGLWPVAVSQTAGLALVAAVSGALAATGRLRTRGIRLVWKGAVPAGLLGGGATIAYFAAAQLGLLSVSAVITSLYPATTVLLAVLVLNERLRRLQGFGLGLAAVAVALLAIRA